MKYFTRKFYILLLILWLLVICLPATLLLLFGMPAEIIDFSLYTVSTYIVFLILAKTFWNYPDLIGNGLVIRNVLYRFYRKKYEYEDIRKVEICRGSIYHWPCIRIYVKSHTKSYFHSLDCMSQDSIPEFLAELREHGVDAECAVKY